jgi:hypothetical protein
MRYDISKTTAPAMPNLGKGTECVRLLLSQTSKDMHEPLVPMLFPPLGAHVSGAEFKYPDNTWKEVCGLMANIVADSGPARHVQRGAAEGSPQKSPRKVAEITATSGGNHGNF